MQTTTGQCWRKRRKRYERRRTGRQLRQRNKGVVKGREALRQFRPGLVCNQQQRNLR